MPQLDLHSFRGDVANYLAAACQQHGLPRVLRLWELAPGIIVAEDQTPYLDYYFLRGAWRPTHREYLADRRPITDRHGFRTSIYDDIGVINGITVSAVSLTQVMLQRRVILQPKVPDLKWHPAPVALPR